MHRLRSAARHRLAEAAEEVGERIVGRDAREIGHGLALADDRDVHHCRAVLLGERREVRQRAGEAGGRRCNALALGCGCRRCRRGAGRTQIA